MRTAALLFLSAVLLPACNQFMPTQSVSGAVTAPSGAVFPAGATVTVEVRDVSLQDAPSTLIGQVRITDARAFPVKFRVPFDPARIQARNTYAVSARVERDGQLLFISDTRTDVLTGGAGTTADVNVVPVQR
ncbi:YbaY family lipoprotein [Deinococcus maricopensis]|uniref:Lipoprotein n=1 Tax=Deinococcus maricopensis (strain DSM 21211 / LMG 22137 / NRRL B-23946 / LB-34) TaxID=709986 RepID=E8U4A3_DEIML|nr:YbaY family lipoprotein [Deinococcus maricopensis]ADV65940.1 hypothetical protein Deima_0278 [Deinococcus maricopensis DSM 21211]